MALYHEDEMNERKKRREEMRRKREAEQKKLIKGLAIAGVLLILFGIRFYTMVKDSKTNQVIPDAVAEQTEQTTEATTEPVSALKALQTPTTIHIKAAGDLNITNSVVSAGLAATGYDYSRAFMDVATVLSDADLTVLNFEGNVCGEPYGSATTSAPKEILDGLRRAGVDLVQTANSRSIQNGLIGLTSTLSAIRQAGLEPIGSFSSPAEFRQTKGYTICTVQGIKVAFVGFTKGFLGMGMPTGNEECVNLLYTDYATTYDIVDKDGINALLKEVAKEEPDITIALVHWGSENNESVSATQESIVNLMKKAGVDVILGTHSHTLQHIVFDELKGTLVAYSLGDFFGDGIEGGTNYSIILDIEITRDPVEDVTKVTNYSYTPIYTLKEEECDGYRRVVRIEQAMTAYNTNFVDKVTDTAYAGMEKAMTRIPERLTPPVVKD
jgi:poly-gamma-glutamate synthesis protein (capsule biosynthesis protein)